MKALWLAGLFVLLTYSSFGQTTPVHVSHIENPDGTVSVVAENHGFAPVTVYLSAELVNMSSSVPLPAKMVVFPSKTAHLLTSFSRKSDFGYSYRYHAPTYFGIYSSHFPDTTFAYHYPFAPHINWRRQRSDGQAGRQKRFFNAQKFTLPPGTPVLAIRDGIVVHLEKAVARNKRHDANYLAIVHADGTCAYYLNLDPNSTLVTMGQPVKQGMVLASSSSEKKTAPLWLIVYHLGVDGQENLPIKFAQESQPGLKSE